MKKLFFLIAALSLLTTIHAQQIDDTGLHTPSGLIYTTDNPQLEFSYFDTYDLPPDSTDTRVFAKDRIPKATTTYVYAELGVKNLLYNVRDQEYKLTFKFYQKGRALMGEFDTKFTVKKDWDFAWYYDSWGWETPGEWPTGSHTVEVWINDTKFAVREFTIVP